MLGRLQARAAEAVAALRASLRNRELRRVQVAWACCNSADFAQEVALSVYAFVAGGVGAVGAMGLARSLPAAVLAPVTTSLASPYRRERVLMAVLVTRAGLLASLAAVVAADSSLGVVFVLAAVDAVVYTLFWPTQSSMLPDLARTPDELTASNGAATLIENAGGLLGPAAAGVVLALVGPSWVFVVSAAVTGFGALAVVGVRVARAPRLEEEVRPRLLAGFATLRAERAPGLIFALYVAHIFCLGALSVLVVVIALDMIETGDSGVGFLTAAVGVGGLLGSLGALGLVGRGLTSPFRRALALWGATLAVIAIAPHPAVAVPALVVLGSCNAVIDVCALNLLQRVIDDRALAPVLGVVEGTWWAAFGVGAVATAGLVGVAGPTAGVLLIGGFLVAVSFVAARALPLVDQRARVPERALAAVEAVPLFAGQSPLALERLAMKLVPVTVEPGEVVIKKGEPGDRFYLVDEGRLRVRGDAGRKVLGPGAWFGEVALLLDVPRNATVRAVTAARLLTLTRDDFLSAVTVSDHPHRATRPVVS